DRALASTVVRPIYLYSWDEITKEMVLSSKKYGSVRRAYIVAAEDKVLKKEFQKWMIEKNPPDEVEEIQGSDHMPMTSEPLQLYTTLLRIANKTAFVHALEAVDGGAKFEEDVWSRLIGGDGISRVLQDGDVFERPVLMSLLFMVLFLLKLIELQAS
ncbi:hypothetical protein HAX54_019136, partial [Datura stramonium]|nr:hypothetical protein [Datura stramonium]